MVEDGANEERTGFELTCGGWTMTRKWTCDVRAEEEEPHHRGNSPFTESGSSLRGRTSISAPSTPPSLCSFLLLLDQSPAEQLDHVTDSYQSLSTRHRQKEGRCLSSCCCCSSLSGEELMDVKDTFLPVR
ncbi:hypothetical protein Q5P01_025769 [Channa striata]|uniref:Uncharacterized protein n=1 Tax=Channa striata TaxID=64152 RepID=A0AA88IXF3_CHASR|nr:hypothetical protein Q5P01_025769 [Channa striata]